MYASDVKVSQTVREDTMGGGDFPIISFSSIKEVENAIKTKRLSEEHIISSENKVFDLPDGYTIIDGIEPFTESKTKKIVRKEIFMDNFEEKLAIYQTKLENYLELADEIFNKPAYQKYKRVLLSPSNEVELEFANTMLAILSDIECLSNGKIKEIDFKSSATANFIKTLYNKVKDISLFDKIDLSDIKIDNETFANIMYEEIIIGLTNSNDISEYMAELIQNNAINALKLYSVLKQSGKILQQNTSSIEDTKKILERIHILFQNEIINLQDENDTIDTKKLTFKLM